MGEDLRLDGPDGACARRCSGPTGATAASRARQAATSCGRSSMAPSAPTRERRRAAARPRLAAALDGAADPRRRETPELGWGASTLIENEPPALFAQRCDWQDSRRWSPCTTSRANEVAAELELGDDVDGVDDLLELREHRVGGRAPARRARRLRLPLAARAPPLTASGAREAPPRARSCRCLQDIGTAEIVATVPSRHTPTPRPTAPQHQPRQHTAHP